MYRIYMSSSAHVELQFVAPYRRRSFLEPAQAEPVAMAATPSLDEEDASSDVYSALTDPSSPEEALLPLDETFKRPVRSFWSRNSTRIAAAVSALFLLFLLGAYLAPGRRSSSHPPSQLPHDPLLVSLPGYGTLQGIRVVGNKKNIPYEKPIDAWLGVEYSTQPADGARFAPPDWPKEFTGTRNATQYGKACMQNWGWNPSWHSEACLTLNLFRPSGIPVDKKLPIFVFFHGGSFVVGDGKSLDAAQFILRSSQPLMVAVVQYRLGALGSLSSKLFEEEGLLNLGIRDQRMALEFLQNYLTYFGGDPARVTLGGQSAGAHSVGIHLFHNYGESGNKKLFSQAILASGAPTARSFAPATYPLYERYFEEFMHAVGCSIVPDNSKMLACLKTVDVRVLQRASRRIYEASNYNVTWPWQPNSPGPLLEKPGSTSGINGTFYKVPVLISTVTDEGKLFAPKDMKTNADFERFFKTLLPGLTEDDFADLVRLYPDPSEGNGPYVDHEGPFISTQFERLSAAYGDYSYICPVQETAYRVAKSGAPVYKARFNTRNSGPLHMGVPHATDQAYFNGHVNVQFPEVSEIYHSYYASFVVSGDPNTYKSVKAPTWDRYWGLDSGQLAVGNPGRGGIVMEKESAGLRMADCAWWRDEQRMLRLFK